VVVAAVQWVQMQVELAESVVLVAEAVASLSMELKATAKMEQLILVVVVEVLQTELAVAQATVVLA
jgi:hypothetical protein